MQTASALGDGYITLSEPISAFDGTALFDCVYVAQEGGETRIYGVYPLGDVREIHPVPFRRLDGLIEAGTALAALGYTLA
ncbi:hypothetical protein [Xanthobacter sp. YC-JY1]|uniref:hypothetical protein n=1 Tax=Xanthobacter sp. YC-JY1 TaxID=2419844 RepID=UPI001F26BEEA|nr:hypothetical protein [Xanthobacter sp. YC-JY1]UJX46651.1 hypothetical protein D7006_19375 [Xanthobacter sp. YC-JY1]